ncbi:MAG TPA: TetR/AcrR family transcriptional regulator [Roseiarcus sp.]|nr:TetR/AcrR family transcriptional regulator [Roseiarcus sp.]
MKTPKRPYSMTLRAEKAAETRRRILESAMTLYAGRSIEDSTLDEVARMAATTVQTVLRAFDSKENLLLAAMHRFAERGASLKPTPPGDVRAAVSAIYDLYETMGDLLIRRLADEPRRPVTKPELDAGRANHRAWVEDIFAPLVKGRGKAVRAEMLGALTAATDVYVWQKLRRDMKLNRPAAEAVVRRTVLGVTNRELNDGEDSLAQLVRRREPAA